MKSPGFHVLFHPVNLFLNILISLHAQVWKMNWENIYYLLKLIRENAERYKTCLACRLWSWGRKSVRSIEISL